MSPTAVRLGAHPRLQAEAGRASGGPLTAFPTLALSGDGCTGGLGCGAQCGSSSGAEKGT